MSSEVCPFCGKSFKRLKSHLPHCKVKPASDGHVGANQTTSSPQLTAAILGVKGTSPNLKSTKAALPSSPSPPPPPSVKKKRLKLSEQIKLLDTPPSPADPSPLSSPRGVSKPKKQSLRALIEAYKTSPPTFEGTKPEELLSSPTLVSRNERTSPTNIIMDQASLPDANLADVPKKKATKKAKQAPPPSVPDSVEAEAQTKLWVDVVKKSEDAPENNLQARVFIQDAKSILGRAKRGKTKILDWTATTDEPVPKTRLDSGSALPPGNPKGSLTNEATLAPLAEIKSLTTSKSELASLIPAERHVPSQIKLFVPETSPPPPALVGRRASELLTLSPSPVKFSSPPILPVLPQSVAWRAEPTRASDWPRAEGRNQADAEVTRRRRLADVKLRELPDWLMSRTPTHPAEVVEMVQRGWQWYYRRYIDVKKGGLGGISMLLAGYCVLSYIWRYPQIKQDRWRKYH